MQEKGNRTIEELLSAYPDVSVCRDRLGSMVVFIGEQKRLILSLGRETSDQGRPHLTIAIPPETEEGKYLYVKIFPVSKDGAEVKMEGLLDGEDSREIIKRAKQGLELFQAASTTRSEIVIPARRVYDWMQIGDEPLLNKIVQAEQIMVKKAGLSGEEAMDALRYSHPFDQYLYMLKLLNSVVS